MRYWRFLRAHPLDFIFTAVLLVVGSILLCSIMYVALDPEVSGTFMHNGVVPTRTRFFPPKRPYDFPANFGDTVRAGGGSNRPLDYGDFAVFGAAGLLLTMPPLFHFYRYRKWKTESD